MGKRGRPELTDEQAGAQAAHVIEVAFRLRYRCLGLAALGHTEESARLLVGKRHRGKIGALVGNSVTELFPPENRIARAAQLVVEHGFSAYRAARMADTRGRKRAPVDPRNLSRAITVARTAAIKKESRMAALRCTNLLTDWNPAEQRQHAPDHGAGHFPELREAPGNPAL